MKEVLHTLLGSDLQNTLLHQTQLGSELCVVIHLKNKELGKEDCLGKDSQAGNIVFPWEGMYLLGVGAGWVSVDLCYIPPRPKLSRLKQAPFYPAHVSVVWLDGRGGFHMVLSGPQQQDNKPRDAHFSAFTCMMFGEVPLAKAIHTSKGKFKVEK